ncbi:hypothetical protein VOLCADRAFT_101146 [Volvox carteri f. nagariensis]|uniref:Pherophorin domain-containing protein n=1 Tax=Volvox carteri f. nagariensis TaxID=3068 RepID=D8ULV9_VOLCA|nr:uncharacterized protein VOLCADRAFT_101146 [Volvox carteri f. nagariensis]EFJ39290.1 hypothetical protein VOLCADRAFT_101146 [Volvox carteri f. nagariensis]|eukprot:XP_002959645.1 hypothetical protein VOLCADRAFT_101146 [Volvox carteri f. nagariensis]
MTERLALLLSCWLMVIVGCLRTTASAERSLLQAYLETFPPYGCNRDPQQSRFRLDPVYTVSGNRVCMTARVVDCAKPGSDCCDPKIDFYKIELDVNKQCKGAVTGFTVNGKPALAPTFDPYATNDTKAVIKLTGLNLDLTTADGAVSARLFACECMLRIMRMRADCVKLNAA